MEKIVELNYKWIKENNIIIHDYGNSILLLENFLTKDMSKDFINYIGSFEESDWREMYWENIMSKYNYIKEKNKTELKKKEDILHAIATKEITDIDNFFREYERDSDRSLNVEKYPDLELLYSRWKNLFKSTKPENESKINIDRASFITRTTTGNKLTEHIDNSSDGLLVYATVLYVNDNFKGGQLYFPDFDTIIEPKAGSLCVFDGSKNLIHGVKTVTEGTRYSIPAFVWDNTKDDTWRRTHK